MHYFHVKGSSPGYPNVSTTVERGGQHVAYGQLYVLPGLAAFLVRPRGGSFYVQAVNDVSVVAAS